MGRGLFYVTGFLSWYSGARLKLKLVSVKDVISFQSGCRLGFKSTKSNLLLATMTGNGLSIWGNSAGLEAALYSLSRNSATMIAMAPACAMCMPFPASLEAALNDRLLTSIMGLPAADASDGTETTSDSVDFI